MNLRSIFLAAVLGNWFVAEAQLAVAQEPELAHTDDVYGLPFEAADKCQVMYAKCLPAHKSHGAYSRVVLPACDTDMYFPKDCTITTMPEAKDNTCTFTAQCPKSDNDGEWIVENIVTAPTNKYLGEVTNNNGELENDTPGFKATYPLWWGDGKRSADNLYQATLNLVLFSTGAVAGIFFGAYIAKSALREKERLERAQADRVPGKLYRGAARLSLTASP